MKEYRITKYSPETGVWKYRIFAQNEPYQRNDNEEIIDFDSLFDAIKYVENTLGGQYVKQFSNFNTLNK